jgi:hypothetical protein
MSRWLSWMFRASGRRHGADGKSARTANRHPDLDDAKTVFVGLTGTTPHQSSAGPASVAGVRKRSSAPPAWPARDDDPSSTFPIEREPAMDSNSPKNVAAHSIHDVSAGSESDVGDDAPTRLVHPFNPTRPGDQPESEPPSGAVSAATTRLDDDERTVLIRHDAVSHENAVVGWLVVIEGPGQGRSIEITTGVNSIGRAASQKLCLDFGDMQISRDRHAMLIYDPRSKRFVLQRGDDENQTHVEGRLVLEPIELKGGETIAMGKTRLRFVAFCGPDFSWS